jgi:hypothetical protein
MRGRLATILMTFTAVALVVSTMGEATPAYIWNASNSVPVGLYQLQPVGRLAVTELVAVRPPEPLATTTARLRSLGTMVCIVAISALPMLSGRAAHAERSLLTNQQAAAAPANPFAGFVTEASKRFAVPEHWIRAVMRVESGGKLRAVAKGRHGADADHARDVERVTRSIWSRH